MTARLDPAERAAAAFRAGLRAGRRLGREEANEAFLRAVGIMREAAGGQPPPPGGQPRPRRLRVVR